MKRLASRVLAVLICLLLLLPPGLAAGHGERNRHGGRYHNARQTIESSEDPLAPEIVGQSEVVPCAIEGSGYAAPVFQITAVRPTGITADFLSFQWFVDESAAGEACRVPIEADGSATCAYTAYELLNRSSGVYPVYCTVSIESADGTAAQPHSATSYTVNFIVCKGVLEDTLITFSDVHENWDNVGAAISDTIASTGGYVPSLVIASGDYWNDYSASQDAAAISEYSESVLHRIELQLGGIQTVWIAGNHDNEAAVLQANAETKTNADFSDTEILFDDKDVIVIGLDYADLCVSGRSADYGAEGIADSAYVRLEGALNDISQGYHGELVVISAHAGLHTLGVDPASKASGVSAWAGDESYNIPHSYEVVKLINRYADQMDILFFFGHNHSRGEAEFIKCPGDTIISTVDAKAHVTETITLRFTYAHAGYLTREHNGHARYTILSWNDEAVSLETRCVAASLSAQESAAQNPPAIIHRHAIDEAA